MFLKLLNSGEKKVFINLAYLAAKANGVIDSFEKEMLDAYILEIGDESIESNLFSDSYTLSDCLKETHNFNLVVRKSIYIELLSICLSDENFDRSEQNFMNDIRDSFSLDYSFAERAYEWVEQMRSLSEVGFSIVAGEE